jgi:hypothetical protein
MDAYLVANILRQIRTDSDSQRQAVTSFSGVWFHPCVTRTSSKERLPDAASRKPRGHDPASRAGEGE